MVQSMECWFIVDLQEKNPQQVMLIALCLTLQQEKILHNFTTSTYQLFCLIHLKLQNHIIDLIKEGCSIYK